MKKVLFAMPDLRGGGAEKVLIDILKKIDKKKFEITLLLFTRTGVYINEIPKEVKVICIKEKLKIIPGRFWIRYFNKNPQLFYKYLIKEKYDIEIAFMEGLATKFISYSNNNSSKKIAWVHIDLLRKHWTKEMFLENEEANSYNKFDDIIFVSNDAKKSFEDLFENNISNKKIIYNPIIDEEIIEKSNQIKINFDNFTIISVGRLDKQKGYDRLLRVHSRLVNKYPHKLLILGEGEERENLEQLMKELKIVNSVELKGFVKNPHPYIKSANLYVCSSITEGYPLVVAESLILGKGILATDITGPKEILNNGQYGMICEDSEEGLYKSLQSLLEHKEIIKEYENKSKIGRISLDYKKRIQEIEKLFN